MEHGPSVTSLVVVLLAAFLTPILLKKFRLTIIPVVVAEILVGLILGPSVFDLVQEDQWLETLSTLGFIFLMFLSGLEIDFSVFLNKKKQKRLSDGQNEPNTFRVASIIFIGIFLISYLLSLLLVWAGFTDNAFFMTLVISTISLGVVVPTLKETGIMKQSIGQIILLVAVIADLVTMILLAVFVSFYQEGGNIWLLLILFVAGILLYFIGKFFKSRTFFETMSTGTIQIGTRAIFTLIILLVGLSESVGAENILGAFLAGVLVSLLSPNRELVSQLDSFGYGFLIPIFFVMVGVDLNLIELFSDPMVFILIPLLLLALLISKVVPVLVLKRWYDMKTVLGSGYLLTSTLSLVIAASTIGQDIGVISTQTGSSLILLAVVACIISPILFKKVFPEQPSVIEKQKVMVFGANQLTLPLSSDLDGEQYDVSLYHTEQNKQREEIEKVRSSHFTVHYIRDYELDTLQALDIHESDIVVAATGNDEVNSFIAKKALEGQVEHVVARVENPSKGENLVEQGVHTFSSFFSTQSMLRALIVTPSVASIFSTSEEGFNEIELENHEFDGVELRKFPFFGDAIVVRIFRGGESIVPHGDTTLKTGDRLIVTGSQDSVSELREVLS
ncbi:sodium:proton antiporter [Bacillaceae bacterium SIJ1]|uniref:monovalent cation:proton antiporter family protein n=1 Tax=Litoribacterium kuwaitense TaxID=1398745 RepID=UPI0013EB7D19|nr:monovalent cation:proton antiporter family protein [Litoribacterium kuwaitense]NGP44256.1 sodium:proton antiporter [Litoribacterium kuwaitense]